MCFPFPFIFMLIWLSVFMMSNIRCQTLNTPWFYNKCCCSPIYVVFFVRLRIYLSTVLSPFLCNISKIYQSLWRSLCQPLRRLSKFFSMFRKLAEIFLRHCSPNLYKRYPQSFITNALVTDKRKTINRISDITGGCFSLTVPVGLQRCMSLLPTVNCIRHNTPL